ncbi:hypothetical protein LZQ00_13125 [Sphingobacterium sp. SRCM116780]|uniref:hypothetical protein n=1 Tax=Sphingobacterium sp. SRCM116780 TaxID=2907623 RepID=UPI001F27AB69|nr:hypothetical protein [Sphingobacterium sp. SRCM116780]UIR55209.1 hypothetical protein LZQ00_13125 [Sphingobacterium sp. SRCM116780]
MSSLLTSDPIALQVFMSETIFATADAIGVLKDNAEVLTQPHIPQQTSAHQESVAEFIFQGSKEKGILFILRYADFPYFSPEAEDAFIKTIAALKLTLADVAVVNLANAHNPNEFKRIMEFFSPKKIILLGVEPKSLQLPAIAHNSYMHGRVATVFNTFSFEEMFVDLTKKKAFWTEFKSLIQHQN